MLLFPKTEAEGPADRPSLRPSCPVRPKPSLGRIEPMPSMTDARDALFTQDQGRLRWEQTLKKPSPSLAAESLPAAFHARACGASNLDSKPSRRIRSKRADRHSSKLPRIFRNRPSKSPEPHATVAIMRRLEKTSQSRAAPLASPVFARLRHASTARNPRHSQGRDTFRKHFE